MCEWGMGNAKATAADMLPLPVSIVLRFTVVSSLAGVLTPTVLVLDSAAGEFRCSCPYSLDIVVF